MIYGTAEPPHQAHAKRVRSAERQMESDLAGEYGGQSRSTTPPPKKKKNTGSFTFSFK